MPFALVTIGLILIVSGSRDTHAALGKELTDDFTGNGNFLYWLVAIGAVGALGYIEPVRGFSRGFMALIIIAMVLRNEGFADKLSQALALGPVRPGDAAKDITPIKGGVENFKASDYQSNATENIGTALNIAKFFF